MRRWAMFLAVALLAAGPALAAHVIVIGDPDPMGDHTAAVQAALEECSFFGADCEIRFLAGTYRIATVSAVGFHGALRGAGKDATILLPMPGQDPPDLDPCFPESGSMPIDNDHLGPVMMQFNGGDITVSDLTIRVQDWAYAEPWCGGFFQGFWTIILLTSSDIQSRFENVLIESDNDGAHAWAGIYAMGGHTGVRQLSGKHVVVRSTFRDLYWGYLVTAAEGGRFVFGGSPDEGNVVQGCVMGLGIEDMSGSDIQITRNEIDSNGHGMWLGQSLYSGPVEEAAHYKVDHNRVTVHGRMTRSTPNAAIEIVDAQGAAGGPTVVLAEVTNNEVQVLPDLPEIEMRGIRVAFAHGTLVANNKVSGAGASAIDVPDYIIEPTGGFAGYGVTDRVTIRGNNVIHFNASIAPIHLSVGARNCTVIGRQKDVLDEGMHNKVGGAARTIPRARP